METSSEPFPSNWLNAELSPHLFGRAEATKAERPREKKGKKIQNHVKWKKRSMI